MKEKKSTKNFNKAKAKQAKGKQGSGAGKGSSTQGGVKKVKPMKSSGLTKKKIPKSELLEENESVGEQVIKIRRPKKVDQDASVAKHGGSFKGHKKDMAQLAEKDPEFHAFLQQNDKELLNFGDDDSDDDDEEDDMVVDDDDDDDDDDDEEEEENSDSAEDSDKESKFAKEMKRVEVTEKLLNSVTKQAKEGSLSKLRELVAIFRSACIPSTSEVDVDDGEDTPSSKYLIKNSKIYQQVMDTVLDTAHVSMYAVLGIDVEKQFPPNKALLESLGKSAEWKRVQLSVLSFFKSYMHVLGGLARTTLTEAAEDEDAGATGDDKDDSHSRRGKKNQSTSSSSSNGGSSVRADQKEDSPNEITVYLLRAIEPYVPLLTPMPRLCKNFMKLLLRVWAHGPDPALDPYSLRGHAFIRYRQISVTLPGAFAEECFRSIYLSFARSCKGFTEMSATGTLMMTRSIVELYGSDLVQAYQQGFLYIRQLALHLRTAVMKTSGDTVRQVTSWQFLNCLRLWTRVVTAYPAEDELGSLAFPLSQVLAGVIGLAESMYYCPLKFHLTQCLQSLAANCKCFLPTAARMLDILEHQDISSKAVASTDVLPSLPFCVKLPTDSLTRAPVRDMVVEEAIALIRHDAEIYRHHVGFPEYTYLTIRKLRSFAKGCKITKWRGIARTLISQLEGFSNDVKKARSKLGQNPAEVTAFEPLLPPGGEAAAKRLMKLSASRTRGVSALSEAEAQAPGAGNKGTRKRAEAGLKTGTASRKEGEDEEQDSESESESEEGDENEDEDEDEEEEEEDEEGLRAFDINKF